jgi:hypothetical protein
VVSGVIFSIFVIDSDAISCPRRDVFNTSNTDDVVKMILETGEITKGTGMHSKKQDSTRH